LELLAFCSCGLCFIQKVVIEGYIWWVLVISSLNRLELLILHLKAWYYLIIVSWILNFRYECLHEIYLVFFDFLVIWDEIHNFHFVAIWRPVLAWFWWFQVVPAWEQSFQAIPSLTSESCLISFKIIWCEAIFIDLSTAFNKNRVKIVTQKALKYEKYLNTNLFSKESSNKILLLKSWLYWKIAFYLCFLQINQVT